MKVELLKVMDSEIDIANIARTSTARWYDTWDSKRDEGLIETLVFEGHWNPIGQIQLRFRFQMPIVIARQYLRSAVGQTFTEMSRRYVGMEVPPEIWWPPEWRGKPPKGRKQGSSGPLDAETQGTINSLALIVENESLENYRALTEEVGLANEQARWFLPQGTETVFIQTGSLAYYARVCALRRDSHAQAEIQTIANELDTIIAPLFPHAWKCMMFLADEEIEFRKMVKMKFRHEKEHPGTTTATSYNWLA